MFRARRVLNFSAVVMLWVCNVRHVLLFWVHAHAPPNRAGLARLCFYAVQRFILLNKHHQHVTEAVPPTEILS